ncbi:MAG: ribosome assembly RNA-binding protein YhbY [Lachnospiraceae bacterium]|nr:ribosome assembly RNA-binding protein YhbY [Lachnospiraceae bacterium]
MDLTSKQRAHLKGLAMNLDTIFNVGKASLTPEFTQGISETFNNRELIKISVLKNCIDDPREIANVLADRTGATVVQVIGKKIVLYKQAKDEADRKIVLPKDKKQSI